MTLLYLNRMSIFIIAMVCCFISACSILENKSFEYDLVIRNGQVLDGTGRTATQADIAIKSGQFVLIGAVSGKGIREINARGKYVSPGWIDMMDQSGEVLLKNGLAENKLLMGVTSAIGGESGTPVPAGEIRNYFKTLEQQGISINFGTYYNAFQARSAIVGDTATQVTTHDINKMKELMSLAMEEGVMGMSSAAFYPPASLLTTHELIELGKAIAPYGGIYAAHMRDESRHLLKAIEEMITVGEKAGIGVEIFHFKNAYAPHWDKEIHKAINMINSARDRGIDVAANQYPYVAGGTGIEATVPNWVLLDGDETAIARLNDSAIRTRIKKEILDPLSDRMVNNSGGWKNIVLANAYNKKYEHYRGENFVDIGKSLGLDPADAAWNIMLEAVPNRAYALYFMMSEKDVQTIMKQPWVSIGSDAGAAEVLGEVDAIGLPHPRAYGTFPRIIAKYVREEGLLTLEEAIRKMTSLSAKRMKLKKRGVIQKGHWADVVIFDYDKIKDNATWKEPLKTPSGIDYVLVNGVIVVENGVHSGKKPGKVLYGPGYQSAKEG
jgi:N-acyl-D-amino-acid deacylase